MFSIIIKFYQYILKFYILLFKLLSLLYIKLYVVIKFFILNLNKVFENYKNYDQNISLNTF